MNVSMKGEFGKAIRSGMILAVISLLILGLAACGTKKENSNAAPEKKTEQSVDKKAENKKSNEASQKDTGKSTDQKKEEKKENSPNKKTEEQKENASIKDNGTAGEGENISKKDGSTDNTVNALETAQDDSAQDIVTGRPDKATDTAKKNAADAAQKVLASEE